MGVEGKDKAKALEAGAFALSGQLGRAVMRLRKAHSMSLSELSEHSGVAKSIISQIERNETNPTLATIWRLAQALDVSIDRVLQGSEDEPFIEKSTRNETPNLVSEDGKCHLAIIGWIKTVGGLRKTRHKGLERLSGQALFAFAAYNLTRMLSLMRTAAA